MNLQNMQNQRIKNQYAEYALHTLLMRDHLRGLGQTDIIRGASPSLNHGASRRFPRFPMPTFATVTQRYKSRSHQELEDGIQLHSSLHTAAAERLHAGYTAAAAT